MGCGGSKEGVASGNSVTKTDNADKTSTGTAADPTKPMVDADTKDIVAVANTEGKLIGKDEVALEAEIGSCGYRTPLAEEHATPRHGVGKDQHQDHVVEAVAAAAVVETKTEEVKKDVGGATEGGAGVVDGQNTAVSSVNQVDGNGDESRKNPTSVEEATLAKEETKVVEEKNPGESKTASALP